MGRMVRSLAPVPAAIAALAALSLAALALAAPGAMHSTKLGPSLCETSGGGRFVSIPGFPGERIDRRLLRDVRMLVRRYKIFVTDGYSTDPVHSANGEHPIGLALDIVPNKAAGGRWSDIDRLAAFAEPRQNRPRAPFRWVGYDGDSGHGRNNHLHLSWNHSTVKPRHKARTVYTLRCPRGGGGGGGGGQTPDGGGTVAGERGDGPASGGIVSKRRLAGPPVAESGGVGVR